MSHDTHLWTHVRWTGVYIDMYIRVILPQLSPLRVTEGECPSILLPAPHVADLCLVYILGIYIYTQLSPLRVTEVYILGSYRLWALPALELLLPT